MQLIKNTLKFQAQFAKIKTILFFLKKYRKIQREMLDF